MKLNVLGCTRLKLKTNKNNLEKTFYRFNINKKLTQWMYTIYTYVKYV